MTIEAALQLNPMAAGWGPHDYAISLARVSDAVQTSLTEQHELNLRCANSIGLPVPPDGCYSDTESRTLALSARTDFQSAMDRMRDPHCRVMICFDDSRVLGDPRQVLDIFEHMARWKTRLFWKTGVEQDVVSSEGQLIGLIQGWKNKAEVERLRARVKALHEGRARKGRLISRPPYGVHAVPLVEAACGGTCKGDWQACRVRHDRDPEGAPCGGACGGSWWDCHTRHGELSKKNTVWIIDAQELANLTLMYRAIAGGKTWGQIERLLMAEGIRTQVRVITRSKANVGKQVGGQPWEKSVIQRVLRNPFYRGVFSWNVREVVREGQERPRAVPRPEDEWIQEPHALGALVDEQLWWDAYEQMVRRAKTREESAVYGTRLWNGFIWCDRCGRKMAIRQRKGSSAQDRFDYFCNKNSAQKIKARESGICAGWHSIPELSIDAIMAGVIPAHGRMPEFEVTFSLSTEKVDSRAEIDRIGARLSKLEGERSNAKTFLVTGDLTRDDFLAQLKRIDAEAATLRGRLHELEAIPDDAAVTTTPPEALPRLLALLRNEAIPIEDRRQELTALVDRIYVDRPRVRVLLREQAIEA